MATQQFEYKQFNPDIADVRNGDLEDRINELAAEGWVLDERCTWQGSTIAMIFRRPVDDV
ncbi:hypothetical protein [Halalkalicoccus jeotgali]|uniref:DUF4177 domain-containing protein n=1 Tax=Halalkalicoccus jeotgali (strain DSM 18796 / CECT 7217 / JCM 14584 / KCTC 4019 / B3) TaxID=795797 RepID=D8J9U7_HALJB|nr:hypothetical protein [Halalkalicoccus jeotgali]ADJ14469.1 hypothetical protein HacjB3_05390 [Halalkalicoccus jeotgali B3]ELY40183.1 hypothetical protein C497_03765 [Halalkalicoccus jeotgali B3]